MGAIASHEAHSSKLEYIPDSKGDPGVNGAFGMLAAYTAVLAYGVFENFSIETFEATMNVVAIAGFAVPYAVFWRSSNPQLSPALDQYTIACDVRVAPKNANPLPMEPWGSPRIIGFLDE